MSDYKKTALENDQQNADWMRKVYASKEYWSEELQYGNRWSKDAPIKDYRATGQTFDRLVRPFLPTKLNAGLEIGPGGGRWTAELLRVAKHMHLVDISESVIEICRERYKYYHNMDFHITDDASINFIPDNSLDLIFSWGVFVHISSGLVEKYVSQFAQKMTESGIAFIQHGNLGTHVPLNRSNVTKEWFDKMVERHGLTIRAQFGTSEGYYPEYKDGKERVYLDTLSVIEKTKMR